MKAFNLALLSATVCASDYSITRSQGEPIMYWVIGNAANSPTTGLRWWMNVQCVYDNDTGYEWVEIEHVLEADIKSTDVISFELAFTSQGDPYADRVNDLAYDSGLCNLAINAADNRFWVQTTNDQYYQCSTPQCITTEPTFTQDTTNDWMAGTNWIVDEDEDKPFCTPHATDTTTFQCSQISCKYRRKLDTGDAKDFAFLPENEGGVITEDAMLIG